MPISMSLPEVEYMPVIKGVNATKKVPILWYYKYQRFGTLFMYKFVKLRNGYRSRMYPIEYHVAHAKQHYTGCAYSQCQLGIGVTLERGQWIITFLDVHRFHNQEIIIQGDDRID